MTITRRDAVSLMAMAFAAAPFPMVAGPLIRRRLGLQPGALGGEGAAGVSGAATPRLFFAEEEIGRIRDNASSPFLKPTFEQWRAVESADVESTITKVLDSGDLLYEWGTALEAIYRQAMLALLTGDDKHRDLTMVGLRTLRELPDWDYMRDGGTKVLGLMRASKATTAALFSLEVLGSEVPDDLREQTLLDVAAKGCEPCYLTIYHMNNPEEADGWGVDNVQKDVLDWNMSRWPWILAVNNLRAIPTMGLGLGALALEGRDERAGAWRAAAVESARRFLNLFEPDGSYDEGISYVDYAFRTLFLFLEADYRRHGDIDWVREINFEGVVDYIVALQNGRTADGTPDIINISDSNYTVFTCVPSWIANRSDNGLAAYAAHEFSRPGYFADFLWYRPGRDGVPPTGELKNVRLDLDWIVSRTGWGDDDTVVSFRSGGPTNHEHADRNTFTVKVGGERLLTDHFGASYDSRQPHWLLRLPVAHNAVLVDGAGHQYHHGEEGTNASKAHAQIVSYQDGGNLIYWSSDATAAFKLVDDRIELVRRSIIFRKPDLIVVIDEISASDPVSAQILFHPDNRDGKAVLELFTGAEFAIQRPNARLRGRCFSNVPLDITRRRLDLPAEHGEFPYLEASTAADRRIRVLTTLQLSADDIVEVDRLESGSVSGSGWRLRRNGDSFATILLGEGPPNIELVPM